MGRMGKTTHINIFKQILDQKWYLQVEKNSLNIA